MLVSDSGPTRSTAPPRLATAPLAALAAGLALVLLAFARRYGHHRDELYFLRAGREAAFGFVDQPPLTPLLAAAMNELVPGSLLALRLPSALAAAGVVVLTGLLAREFGGGRAAQPRHLGHERALVPVPALPVSEVFSPGSAVE